MSDYPGDFGKARLADRTRPAIMADLCADCGAAGLHRWSCPAKPSRNVPAPIARGFARGLLGPVAWDGFVDAVSGVSL